ncbi:MAG: peptidoglycan DD-metalloendopeptidase family protein [Arachnia sp.]
MRTLLPILVTALLLLGAPPARADGLTLEPPVAGAMVRGFDDVGRFAAGHRGVDLAGSVGEEVRAAAPGRVSFAGWVAGTPTVSIDHGNGWRTTYQPVTAVVAEGEAVGAGQPIGTLRAGHCALTACLHWGLTDGVAYADPTAFLETPTVRLLPRGAEPRAAPSITAAAVPMPAGRLPVAGRLSSPFGMRVHPVTGVYKLHDGTDIAAPCGSGISLPFAGTVTRTGWNSAYGWRVFVDHGGGIVTAYNHLPAVDVEVGTRIAAGGAVGRVGSTGLSTGCHLHWMAWRDGGLIDPLTLVGAP